MLEDMISPMELGQLRYFCAVVDAGGFSRAAQRVFMFPAAVALAGGFESSRMNLVRGCSIAWGARCGSPSLGAPSCRALAACCAKSNRLAAMSRNVKLQLAAPFAWA